MSSPYRHRYDIEWLERRLLLTAAPSGALLPIGRRPDLFGGLFLTTLANRTVPANGQVPVTFEILNDQAFSAGAFTVAFYLSDDPTIATSDVFLTNKSEAAMSGNSTRDDSITLQLPATDPFFTDNNYYIGMIVDSADAVSETNELNNSNTGTGSDRDFVKSERNLPTPANGTDVIATPVTMNTRIVATLGEAYDLANSIGDGEWVGDKDIDTYSITASAGESVAFDITTDEPNVSFGGQGLDTYIRLYNSSFTLLASNNDGHALHDAGDPGNSYLEFTFGASGTYYLAVSGVDNSAANPRLLTGRNDPGHDYGRYDLTVHDVKPDLIGSISLFSGIFSLEDNTVPVSGIVKSKVSVFNLGYQNAGAFNVDVYLSDDATITTSDIFIAHVPFTSAELNTTTTLTQQLTLPSPDPLHTDNQYYLGVLVDTANTVAETNETNNASSGYGLGPAEYDLPQPTGSTVVSPPALSLNASASGTLGDEWIGTRDQDLFTVTTTVANQTVGFDLNTPAASALDSYLRVYDSAWNLLASNDNGVSPLDTGTHATDSYVAFTFATAAKYYLVVSGAGDNSNDPRLLTARTAASTGAYTITATAPDLTVSALTVTPRDPLPANGQTTAQFTVNNVGLLDSPATTLTMTIALGNQVLGAANIPAIPAGQSFVGSLLITLPTPPNLTNTNNLYPLAGTVDRSNIIPEGSDGNNSASVNVSYEADIPLGATSTNTVVRAKSTSIGATTSGDIGGDEWVGAYDIDIFSVTATANEKISVNLDRTSGNLDSYVRAYDPNFGLLAGNDNGAPPGETLGTDSYLEFTATAAGTYYVAVSSTANSTADPRRVTGRATGSTGAYNITIGQISPPHVISGIFEYLTQQDVSLVLSEFGLSLSGAVTLLNRDNSATSGASAMVNNTTATITFPGQPGNILSDGNYRLTVNAASVADSSGNHLDGNGDGTGGDNYTFDFFFLNADANRDRVVNALDFNALASNFGESGKTFAEGNFNYDAHVNTVDFDLLAAHFNKTVSPIPAEPLAVPVPSKLLFSVQSMNASLADVI